MKIAFLLSRHRRALLMLAASVLLHYTTIDWVGAHIGPMQNRPAPAAPVAILAQLHLAAPTPAAPAPVSPPAPPRPVPHPHAAAQRPVLPEFGPDAAPIVDPSEPMPIAPQLDQLPPPPVPEAGALPPTPPAEIKQAQAAGAASTPDAPAPTPPAPPAGATPHRFKVNLPPSAEIGLDVLRVDPDGSKWHGVAAMNWKLDGGSYRLSVEAGLSLLVTRVNLLVLTSEGGIDDAGIAPVLMSEKRRGRSETATHFNRAENTISFSASERSLALLPGAQDQATLPFQLAGIGRADPGQFSGEFDIMVGEDRDASVFHFVPVGAEELDTPIGKLQTLHLSRPPRPGTYSSQLDIWLAPERNWYPVQIRNTEANGGVTTQTVSQITAANPGK